MRLVRHQGKVKLLGGGLLVDADKHIVTTYPDGRVTYLDLPHIEFYGAHSRMRSIRRSLRALASSAQVSLSSPGPTGPAARPPLNPDVVDLIMKALWHTMVPRISVVPPRRPVLEVRLPRCAHCERPTLAREPCAAGGVICRQCFLRTLEGASCADTPLSSVALTARG